MLLILSLWHASRAGRKSPLRTFAVVSVTEVNLGRIPRAFEGEVEGIIASMGQVMGGCGVKVAVRG